MICWRCLRRIDDYVPGWLGDGCIYPTSPPSYAHASCPPPEEKEPPPPIRLVARHCRSCGSLLLAREDAVRGADFNLGPIQFSGVGMPHKRPDTADSCLTPDFGPEVVIVSVPW